MQQAVSGNLGIYILTIIQTSVFGQPDYVSRQELCSPSGLVMNIAAGTFVAIVVGVLISLYLRTEHEWSMELTEYFMGGIISSSLLAMLFCIGLL